MTPAMCGFHLEDVVPIAYRNDDESRRLIAAGLIADPWAHLRAEWAMAAKGEASSTSRRQ